MSAAVARFITAANALKKAATSIITRVWVSPEARPVGQAGEPLEGGLHVHQGGPDLRELEIGGLGLRQSETHRGLAERQGIEPALGIA